jgi:Fic-DOC domain mobile mystery protein B
VTGPLDEPDDANTPLSHEEREGLIPTHVTTRGELNELEAQNITEAVAWAFGRRRDVLTESFALTLHRRMFAKVWRWAGTYRTSNKNLGPNYFEVQPQLVQALENVRYWVEHKTYPPDEIALRLHRDIVWIHPFPNGNGRWSRMMADLLLVQMGQPRFTWGSSALRAPDEMRRAYIDALRAADYHDFQPLLRFSRS